MRNKKLSKQLYGDLITGKYINKKILNGSNVEIENELFSELEINTEYYQEYYNDIGYSLISESNYYYLKKEEINTHDNETLIDKIILKEYVFFVVLIRYLLDNKIDLNKTLLDNDLGLSKELIQPMFEDSKYTNILLISEIKKLDYKVIEDILERKNIVIKNTYQNYCLTSIGIDFLNHIEKIGTDLLDD